MSKESYYFSHDSNARNDEKILMLRAEHGWEGYGVYWMLIEMLFESSESKLSIKKIKGMALSNCVTVSKLQEIIDTAIVEELFESDGEFFWSNSLIKRKNKLLDIKKNRSEAGKKGMEKRWNKKENIDNTGENDCSEVDEENEDDNSVITELYQNYNGVITNYNKGKERKGKEKKGEEKKEEERKEKKVEKKEKNLKDFYPPAFSSFSSLSEEQKEWLKTTISMTPDFRLSPEELFELGNRNFEYIRKQFLDFKKKGATKFYSALKYGWIEEGGWIAEKPIKWRETE